SPPARLSRVAWSRTLRRAIAVAPSFEQQQLVLNQFKDRELLRIDMRHLVDRRRRLEPFAKGLTDLAELILMETFRLCQKQLPRTFGTSRTVTGISCGFS